MRDQAFMGRRDVGMTVGKIALAAAGAGAVVGIGLVVAGCGDDRKNDIDATVGDLMNKYDRNRKDGLDVEFETTQTGRNSFISRSPQYSYDGYLVREGIRTEHRYEDSVERLARVADDRPSGNSNGVATSEELAKVLRTFDRGNTRIKNYQTKNRDKFEESRGDNKLQGSEWESFKARFGESAGPGQIRRTTERTDYYTNSPRYDYWQDNTRNEPSRRPDRGHDTPPRDDRPGDSGRPGKHDTPPRDDQPNGRRPDSGSSRPPDDRPRPGDSGRSGGSGSSGSHDTPPND